MSDRTLVARSLLRSPITIFVFVLLLAFCAEYAIMLLLAVVPIDRSSSTREALIDSTLLTLVLAPAFWLVVVRPLQRLSASRGELISQLFNAQEQERARLARDLHDELGQQLTAMLISIRTIEQAPDLPEARERARTAAAAGAASLNEVRRISRGLHPTVLDDLGLVPAIERLCREFQDLNGISVQLSIDLPPSDRFPPPIEVCVFRILQESLTNIARHADATTVSVLLTGGKNGVHLEVRDDGRGLVARPAAGASLGLHGMHERVSLLDGRFEISSSAGKGTTVRVDLPAAGEGAPR